MPCLDPKALSVYFYSSRKLYVHKFEEISRQSKIDVRKAMVKTKYNLALNEIFNLRINKDIYKIKIIADS